MTRIVQLPPRFHEEPGSYIGLLTAALEQSGVQVRNDLYLSEAAEHAAEIDAVHLHWLEYVVGLDSGRASALARSGIRVGRFLRDMWRLRRAKVGIVWTAHNLAPHEPRHPHIERFLNIVTLMLCDAVIVHSGYARDRLVAKHRLAARKAVVIPHANYAGVYPEPEPRATPKNADEPFEFLCFGHIRPYKQLPELITAFRALSATDVRLRIAGKPVDDAALRALRDVAGDDPRVVIEPEPVPFEDVAALHHRADAAVFAYRDVFSSGAMVLALSFGLPVVVPEQGAATELVRAPGSETFGPGGLTEALERMHTGDHAARVQAALDSVAQDTWAHVAESTTAVYDRAIARRAT